MNTKAPLIKSKLFAYYTLRLWSFNDQGDLLKLGIELKIMRSSTAPNRYTRTLNGPYDIKFLKTKKCGE